MNSTTARMIAEEYALSGFPDNARIWGTIAHKLSVQAADTHDNEAQDMANELRSLLNPHNWEVYDAEAITMTDERGAFVIEFRTSDITGEAVYRLGTPGVTQHYYTTLADALDAAAKWQPAKQPKTSSVHIHGLDERKKWVIEMIASPAFHLGDIVSAGAGSEKHTITIFGHKVMSEGGMV